MLKICKFGGSSLASSAQFKKVKDIVMADDSRKVVVVSAPGKRVSSDYKITDLLYLTYSHLKYKVAPESVFKNVKERYYEIANELGLTIDLDKEFLELEAKMKAGIKEEELVSRGEYLCAKLMSNYLGYDFVDAKDVIHFTFEGKVDEKKTLEAVANAKKEHDKIVIPGFYGAYPNEQICLFSRGGSDVTGSYVAKALQVDQYENWTDVSGILMTDPKVVQNPRKIKEVSYAELRELSYLGASVLHEETILPIADVNIPVVIKNTNAPQDAGTIIKNETKDKYLLTGITGKKDFVALTFVKRKSADKLKAIMGALKVFNKYHVPIEHIPTSIDSFSIVVEKSKVEESYYDIIAEIREMDEIVNVSEDNDIALVAVVGQNMVKKTGISGRILSALGKENINIKLIAQGREELNIIVGISNSDFNKSIQSLYNQFALETIE